MHGRRPVPAAASPIPIAAMTPLAHQLRWYIAIRVVAIVSVLLPFGLFQLWLPAAQQPPEPALVGPPAPAAQATAAPAPEIESLPRNVIWLLGGATFVATLFYIA